MEYTQGIKSITWEAKIFRADGTIEDLGVISTTLGDKIDKRTTKKIYDYARKLLNG